MMNKPWIIWSLSGLCAFFVFAAMALITRHTVTLEKERSQAEAKAEFEGWVRLALWRLDSAAAGILAEENKKPASHFYEMTFPHREAAESSTVKLHFEIKQGVLSSPQKTSEWGAFQSFLKSDNQQVQEKKRQESVTRDPKNKSASKAPGAVSYIDINTNIDVLCAAASNPNTVPTENPVWADQVEVAQQQRLAQSKKNSKNSTAYQGNYNRAEKAKRQTIVSKALGNGLLSINPQKQSQEERSTEAYERTQNASQTSMKITPLTPVWLGADLILVREVSDAAGKRVQGAWLDSDAIRKSLLKDINDLLPDAHLEPVKHQMDFLTGQVSPQNDEDPMVMVALPWRLIPGEMAVVLPAGWTPMRKTLLIAWAGALLAALAGVVLLRGVVKLSERRASFVSSVTHELRTPLTTFSLYSDMLAEGMITDETKQHQYLLTLRRESARLTHLVENVLAYSRIERGSARARVESVRVGEMLDRMLDRLSVRAEEDGMNFILKMDQEVAQKEVKVDITAVEQIIFNLVDNASKYASGEGCGKDITLHVLSQNKGGKPGGYLAFRVCDQGLGIPKSERRRLFRAFHKSAQEAAHTKPGVGLGLALSRRLARALGGDLQIVDQKKGTCFQLTISS